MWLFEKRGFTSTVAYNPVKDYVNSPHRKIAEASENPLGWLLVRARVREDLKAVEEILGKDIHIYTDSKADYSFRALMTRQDMKDYLSKAVDDIDYGAHFKEATRASVKAQAGPRYSAMMSVWSAMANLQPYCPYTGQWRGDADAKTYSYKGSGSGKTTSTFSSAAGKSDSYYDEIFSNVDAGNVYGDLMDESDAWDSGWAYRDKIDFESSGSYYGTTVSSTKDVPTVEEYEASTYWFSMKNLAVNLKHRYIGEISDDDVESMDDETFGVWMDLMEKYGPDTVLSTLEILNATGVDTSQEEVVESSSEETSEAEEPTK